MSISGIGNAQYFIAKLGMLDPFSAEQTTDPLLDPSTSSTATDTGFEPLLNTGTDSTSSASQANFSTAASLLSSLSQLQKQDPDAFKSVAGQISGSLRTAAQECTDPAQSYSLSGLAGKFSNAAATGSLTAVAKNASTNTLRGYGTSSNLVSSYLSQSLNSDLFGAVNALVTSKLNSALSAD